MAYVRPGKRGHSRGDLLSLVAAVILGGVVTSLSPAQEEGLSTVVRRSALAPFLELHRFTFERTTLRRRAAALQSERDSLFEELTRATSITRRVLPIRDLLGFSTPVFGSLVAVEMFPGQSRIGDGTAFMARSPELTGLGVPAGVMTGRGLVGVLRSVAGSTGRGDFWTHDDFRVSVETEDGVITGIVRPLRRDGGQPVMLLEGAPFQREIAPGTVLRTTGLAGVYPAGIVVGTVREQAQEETGWMKRYIVEPAVRPEAAPVALVWRRPLGSELPAVAGADSAPVPPAP